MKRIRRSTEIWQKLITEQEQSGLSASAFCEQQGLSTKTFYRRRKALRTSPGEKPKRFIQVKTDPVPLQTPASPRSIVLHYQTTRLQFSDATPASWVATLMRALS